MKLPTPLLPAMRILLLACLPAIACAGDATTASTDDGPYVFRTAGDRLESLWVCDGKVLRQSQRAARNATVKPRCGYPHPLVVPAQLADPEAVPYSGGRIVALSDIHGQYEVALRLLRAHGVVDAGDDWRFGRGHLVVTGDVFDRGPKVNETFWLLFQLQRQAAAAGGAVHFLLGNHETMVLYDDLRYVNPKYAEVAKLLGKPYPALYGPDSVLGGWLRTRPVMLKLGDTLFLHGGIAPQNLELVAELDATNAAYDASLGKPRAELKADPATTRLYDGKTSPIWYRGYFNGQLTTPEVGALVDRLGLGRIVVGHTTIGEVASFHDGRIVAIDSGIKRGERGQLLFIEDGKLSRGLEDGAREPVPALQEVPDDDD